MLKIPTNYVNINKTTTAVWCPLDVYDYVIIECDYLDKLKHVDLSNWEDRFTMGSLVAIKTFRWRKIFDPKAYEVIADWPLARNLILKDVEFYDVISHMQNLFDQLNICSYFGMEFCDVEYYGEDHELERPIRALIVVTYTEAG